MQMSMDGLSDKKWRINFLLLSFLAFFPPTAFLKNTVSIIKHFLVAAMALLLLAYPRFISLISKRMSEKLYWFSARFRCP
jgi:hypothetical protein